MKKLLLVPALMVSVLSNANDVDPELFMNGPFEKIIRYEAINKSIQDSNSKKIINKAIERVKKLKKNGKEVKVSVIGYTNSRNDDANELSIDSNTYANTIQNWFRSYLDVNSSKKLSKEYALDVQEILVDNGIDINDTFVQSVAGDDLLYLETESKSENLNNRVMITLYVEKVEDIDSDRDGVFDREDKCPGSPRNYPVDERGCSLDSDGDGVLDYKDECPKTPKGVHVDTKGCPLDSDKDGVLDYLDKCPNTLSGLQVDVNGCPLKSKLLVTFATGSDKLNNSSSGEIEKFVNFLKENPAYNATIVGHTDSQGKAVLNLTLSQKRAATVKFALIAEGIEASRLKSVGRGEYEPIATNRTKEGRKQNRRTEVLLSY